jgi:hypothetical protein
MLSTVLTKSRISDYLEKLTTILGAVEENTIMVLSFHKAIPEKKLGYTCQVSADDWVTHD